MVIFDANGTHTTEWMVWETKTNTAWSLLSASTAFFLVKMNIAYCFTGLCSAHSFMGAGNYRETDSKQSSVRLWEGLEKSHHCLHLTNITKATWRMNKVGKDPVRAGIHVSAQSGITSAHNSPPSCLILIAVRLKSQAAAARGCFRSKRN